MIHTDLGPDGQATDVQIAAFLVAAQNEAMLLPLVMAGTALRHFRWPMRSNNHLERR
jgi:hypothetical protein